MTIVKLFPHGGLIIDDEVLKFWFFRIKF